MTIVIDSIRQSDSPLVETVMHGHTLDFGSLTRPAEVHWHMVLSKRPDKTQFLLVGPWSSAGTVDVGPDGEVLWIRFKMGVYMPDMLAHTLVDNETPLPLASGSKFWLKSTAWQFPNFENADTFIKRLVHEELLVVDPIVSAVLGGHQPDVSPRTLRYRFARVVGLSQKHLQQIERAQHAVAMLRAGTTIVETAHALGYYDQSHLTNSLKHFIGYTPSQLADTPRFT